VGQAPSAGRVTFQQAAALALPFPDGGFDVLVCQFGVMFFPNRSRASAKRTAF
jgi:ubiquinone/menaquinone biosynthesis C-methylase UbiE